MDLEEVARFSETGEAISEAEKAMAMLWLMRGPLEERALAKKRHKREDYGYLRRMIEDDVHIHRAGIAPSSRQRTAEGRYTTVNQVEASEEEMEEYVRVNPITGEEEVCAIDRREWTRKKPGGARGSGGGTGSGGSGRGSHGQRQSKDMPDHLKKRFAKSECHACGKIGHIRPYCQEKTHKDGGPCVRNRHLQGASRQSRNRRKWTLWSSTPWTYVSWKRYRRHARAIAASVGPHACRGPWIH